jgi:PKD repeat protein
LAGSNFLPDVAGTYVAQLRVSANDRSDIDTVMITVSANEVPVADAGSDQTVDIGEDVTLDGTGSFDSDDLPAPISYEWLITSAPSGSLASINSADSASASFTPDLAGIYEVQLTVSDGADSASDTLVVTVNEVIPELLMCDVNKDRLVDSSDISLILSNINTQANGDNDPSDWNRDGTVNVLDVRGCTLRCTFTNCAVSGD